MYYVRCGSRDVIHACHFDYPVLYILVRNIGEDNIRGAEISFSNALSVFVISRDLFFFSWSAHHSMLATYL